MAVRIHLESGEIICSNCGAVVKEDAKKCPKCSESFDGDIKEGDIFTIPENEDEENNTQQVVKIFKMLVGSSVMDLSYMDKIKDELEELNAPTRIMYIHTLLKFSVGRYDEITEAMTKLMSRMRKEKKDELLKDLDKLKELEVHRERVLEHIRKVHNNYLSFLDMYAEFIKKKEAMLQGKMDEFQKEVERRKIQAKMLVEKEKDLLEREHRLREREKSLEEKLRDLEETGKSMVDEEGISKEEWMEHQRKIQEKLYQLREEVVKKTQESEKEKLTKEVLKILDDLLGRLPEEVIEEFARSENFDLYKKVMGIYGLGGSSGSS